MATFNRNKFTLEYAETDDKKRTRTAGLELETTITNQKSNFFRANRQNILDAYIREHGFSNARDKELEIYEAGKPTGFAAMGYDGSELEFVTHPDSITLFKQGGSERFKKCMKFLKKNTEPGKGTIASGTHVNIGKLSGDEEEFLMDNAYWICLNFATQLQKIAGRITHWAKFNPYKQGYQKVKSIYINDDSPEGKTLTRMSKPDEPGEANKAGSKSDVLVLKPHGYEFRLFKATNDINEAIAWVELCHNIIMLASGQRRLEDIVFDDLIRGEYISKYVEKLTKFRKLTEIERGASVENTMQFEFYTTGGTILL